MHGESWIDDERGGGGCGGCGVHMKTWVVIRMEELTGKASGDRAGGEVSRARAAWLERTTDWSTSRAGVARRGGRFSVVASRRKI